MKRFCALLLLVAGGSVLTYAWAFADSNAAAEARTSKCGCVVCRCPDCNGEFCSCAECACEGCGCAK